MENESTVEMCFKEYVTLRNKMWSTEDEKKRLAHKNLMNKINLQIENFVEILKVLTESQQTINKERTMITSKIQEKPSDEQMLQLSYTHHNAFTNILNTLKSQNIINNMQRSPDVNHSPNIILNEFQSATSSCHSQVMESLYEYKSTKDFVDSIDVIQHLDLEECSISEQKSDSDLGCYPHDSNLVNMKAVAMSEFATSSPIPVNNSVENV